MHKLAILFLLSIKVSIIIIIWRLRRDSICVYVCERQEGTLTLGTYIASMVRAREQLARSYSGDVVESSGLLAAAVRRPLQHVHQVSNEEVVLQCRHTLLRQDRGLAAHGARQCEAVGRDVILQAPGGRERVNVRIYVETSCYKLCYRNRVRVKIGKRKDFTENRQWWYAV